MHTRISVHSIWRRLFRELCRRRRRYRNLQLIEAPLNKEWFRSKHRVEFKDIPEYGCGLVFWVLGQYSERKEFKKKKSYRYKYNLKRERPIFAPRYRNAVGT